MPSYAPRTTALILIDLVRGITSRDLAPYSGAQVVETGKALAARFRAAGAPVILVTVAFEPGVTPPQQVDAPAIPDTWPEGYNAFVDGLRHDGDVVVVKRHWGAFTGTELDLQLRRRGVRTVVIGGIATNYGVESTARSAWEHSYDVVIVEDACTSVTPELHAFPFEAVFPRIARVTTAEQLALG